MKRWLTRGSIAIGCAIIVACGSDGDDPTTTEPPVAASKPAVSMTDVGLGEGAYGAATGTLRALCDNPASGGGGAECLAAPAAPPSLPQYGRRTRP